MTPLGNSLKIFSESKKKSRNCPNRPDKTFLLDIWIKQLEKIFRKMTLISLLNLKEAVKIKRIQRLNVLEDSKKLSFVNYLKKDRK
jgi:hypothetical protein